MGFMEDVGRAMDESLARKIESAEGNSKRADEEKRRAVDIAASSKIELLILKRGPTQPAGNRIAQDSTLQAKIQEAKERYTKAEQEEENARNDLKAFQGVKTELKINSLQPTA